MILKANCKINLGLDILRRRADGFHDLETVMFPVAGLYDEVEAVRTDTPGVAFRAEGLAVDCAPEENICMKAFRLMQRRYGVERGVALCGSGEGMTMTLNKHQGIRAGLCWDPEVASLIRRHNDANVIVFPARFITNDEAVKMLDAYFAAGFEGGRHEARIAKMPVGSCK